ncbi:hypothetical protein GCM10027062_39660 [Nocardioides hungaricus]
MFTITSEALDALEVTAAWKRWNDGPQGLGRCAQDLYASFLGAQAESHEELVRILGADNMGGGVPVAVAKALARLSPWIEERTPVVDPAVLDQVAAELGLYVYLLVDPRDGVPFYVGKGRGLRYAAHGLEANDVADGGSGEQSRKHARINELRRLGLEHEIWILRYGLTAGEYTSVEAAAIDLLMTFPVTPGEAGQRLPLGVQGQLANARREDARSHGMRLLHSIIDDYAAPPLETMTPLLLITLNGWTDLPDGEVIAGGATRYGAGYKPEWLVSASRVRAFEEIGESLSAWWTLSPASVERRGIRHVAAVHRGVTRALFEIVADSWETRVADRLDARGRPISKTAFKVTPITDGDLFDEVVGRHGHRVVGRAKGAQNSLYYWPR